MVNVKTIKEDLRNCINGRCSRCSQSDKDSEICYTRLKQDVLEVIENLEQRIAIMTENAECIHIDHVETLNL